MDKLRIVSLNTRGMRNNIKRKKLMCYLKDQKADIFFVQETHATNKDNSIWTSQWGNKCIFANGTSQSKGVGILFNKFGDRVVEVIRDMEGRFLIVKLVINEYSFCLCNIYAPNDDDPTFFTRCKR